MHSALITLALYEMEETIKESVRCYKLQNKRQTVVLSVTLCQVMASETKHKHVRLGTSLIQWYLRPASASSIAANLHYVLYFIDITLTKLTLASGCRL